MVESRKTLPEGAEACVRAKSWKSAFGSPGRVTVSAKDSRAETKLTVSVSPTLPPAG